MPPWSLSGSNINTSSAGVSICPLGISYFLFFYRLSLVICSVWYWHRLFLILNTSLLVLIPLKAALR